MILTALLAAVATAAPAWRPIAPGIEYAAVPVERPVSAGDGILHVVRIDPARAELRAHMASEPGERARTAKDWCAVKGLAVAINLGMYQGDMNSNVGYARKGTVKSNGRFNAYKSYLAFGPRTSGLPRAILLDAEDPDARGRLADYDTVVQNLRLIRAPGTSVWEKQGKRWTEAAIASSRDGRILFLFTRTPFTMWEFNRAVLALPLGIRNAMHVEGGPEASLSIRTPAFELHMGGSYGSGARESDASSAQWPIPNVIGVVADRRASSGRPG